MKTVIIISLLLFAPMAFADTGLGSFFSYITGLGEDFWNLLTVSTPNMFDRFWAWVLEFYVLAKYQGFLFTAKISWSVAQVIISDLQVGSQLNNLMGFLPQDVQAALVQLRLLDAIEMLIQAFIAKFAMDAIN